MSAFVGKRECILLLLLIRIMQPRWKTAHLQYFVNTPINRHLCCAGKVCSTTGHEGSEEE